MDKASLATILLLLASVSSSPVVDKRFRPDYTYDVKTDAFYKLHTKSATVQQARLQCQSEGATLIEYSSINDLQQQYKLIQLNLDVDDVFIGVKEQSVNKIRLLIAPESTEDLYQTVYRHVGCKIMTTGGEIKIASCDVSRPYFCKVNAMEVPYNEQCDVRALGYKYDEDAKSCFKVSYFKANWIEAKATCEAEGAHLVVLRNEQDLRAVKRLIERVPYDVEDWQFFAGLSADKTFDDVQPVFKTVFGETLEEVGYAPWGQLEPSNSFSVEYCMSILKNSGKYNDTVCKNLYPFVCQKKIDKTNKKQITQTL